MRHDVIVGTKVRYIGGGGGVIYLWYGVLWHDGVLYSVVGYGMESIGLL